MRVSKWMRQWDVAPGRSVGANLADDEHGIHGDLVPTAAEGLADVVVQCEAELLGALTVHPAQQTGRCCPWCGVGGGGGGGGEVASARWAGGRRGMGSHPPEAWSTYMLTISRAGVCHSPPMPQPCMKQSPMCSEWLFCRHSVVTSASLGLSPFFSGTISGHPAPERGSRYFSQPAGWGGVGRGDRSAWGGAGPAHRRSGPTGTHRRRGAW